MIQYRFKVNYENRYSYSWGYAMYASFLEKLEEELADFAHSANSFTQFITPKEWIINTSEEFEFEEKYHLKKFNTIIELKEPRLIKVTEQEMADKYLINAVPRNRIRLKIITPTTFKQDGEYVLFPSKDLIMQSLTNKWNNWAERFVLDDVVWDNYRIAKYNLRSAYYNIKDVRIQGFIGTIELVFWGSESIIRLANMICNFGNFSGLGVKAALGMGGIQVE